MMINLKHTQRNKNNLSLASCPLLDQGAKYPWPPVKGEYTAIVHKCRSLQLSQTCPTGGGHLEGAEGIDPQNMAFNVQRNKKTKRRAVQGYKKTGQLSQKSQTKKWALQAEGPCRNKG